MTAAQSESDASLLARLPKAELHLHLEGCINPMALVKLAERHGDKLDYTKVAERYNTRTFPAFLDLFKWVTSYLRTPDDYAYAVSLLPLHFDAERCVYAEITLSVGVMLLRKQDVEANFAAISKAAAGKYGFRHTRVQWIFDAVRQFGPKKAMDVARLAVQLKSAGVVAFGIGGDEESLPASDFRGIFEYVASEGLRRVAHAGEMAGPQSIRDAIEILGAERIGHGISAIHDERLMDLLVEHQIPLEICPKSNLCTGALAKLLGVKEARLEDHPLPKFVARSVPVTLATDDPAMFRTSLNETFAQAASKMGLTTAQLVSIAEASFRHSFLPAAEKNSLLDSFRAAVSKLQLR